MTRPPRPSRLAILCLTLFLGLLPLALTKPGFPPSLRADEAGYYAMALSLWHDGDLLLENDDLTRVFREYPTRIETMMVMSHDDWSTVYLSKPFVYPLLVAPVAGLLGANGLVSVNLLLLCAMVWMGTRYLERFNDEATALLFAVGFFLLSPAFPYAFWIHPELFDMAAVAAAIFLVVMPPAPPATRPGLWRLLASATALALGAFNKPILAVLALPLVFLVARRRGRRAAAWWLLALLTTTAILLGVSYFLTRQAWPYLGVSRRAIYVASPIRFVEDRLPSRGRPSAGAWMNDNPPRADARRLLEDVPYFLWGRHVGVLPYMPFGALCLALFLAQGRRSRFRWLLLTALALAAVALMISIPGNWHGGSDFIGNRYFVHLYPAFLFLATRIRPLPTVAAGYAAAALLLGPILLTPFGRTVRHPAQSHVLQAPLRWLPLEISLLSAIPNYARAEYPPGVRFIARRDVFQAVDQEMWLLGASALDLWIRSPQALPDAVFDLRSLAPGNRVEICLERDCRRLGSNGGSDRALAAPWTERVTLRPERPRRIRRLNAGSEWVYRLRVSTTAGEQPRWRQGRGSDFYLGAGLTFLGTTAQLEASDATWVSADLPRTMSPGESVRVPVRVANTSSQPWFAGGPAPVRASYHWLDTDGGRAVWDGARTPLPGPVAAGAEARLDVLVRAPDRPGRFELIVDLVREGVVWFGGADSQGCPRAAVEISASDEPQDAAAER